MSTRPMSTLPLLQAGDRLTRAEFERREASLTDGPKAELIDGVVYMGPPTFIPHGGYHGHVSLWLGLYAARTPGTKLLVDATMRLDEENQPRPDAVLMIRPERGGRARVDPDGCLRGGVELVAEIAASSASYDLHQKKRVYWRHRCQEYLAVILHSREVVWFSHQDASYEPLPQDAQGVIRSSFFPGLWLDARALLAEDSPRLLETLERGIASSEHASFAAELAAR